VGLAATLWASNGKPGDLLLAEGKPLEEALPLITVKGLDLSSDERQLIEASDARVRGRRRARWLMNANGVALLIGGVAACTFWLWKVLPQVASTYAGQDKVLPLSTRFVIASSNYFMKWLLPFSWLPLLCSTSHESGSSTRSSSAPAWPWQLRAVWRCCCYCSCFWSR